MNPTTPRLDAALVKQTVPPGSLRYYSWLYTPADKREVLVALLLLDDEITATGRSPNHDVAHLRLKWWQEELDRLVRGKPAHPATQALLPVAALDDTVPDKLGGLVEGAAIDLARATFTDDGELGGYFERTGGALAEVAARWLCAPVQPQASLLATARRLGSLCRQAESLRELRVNVPAGRIQLPLTVLDAAGIDVAALLVSPWPEALQAMLQTLHSNLQSDLQSASSAIEQSDRTMLRPLLVQASLYARLVQRSGEQIPVSRPRLAELNPFEKWIVSWRAARAAR